MRSIFATLLDRLILTKPLWVLAIVAVLGAYIISFAPDIDLDASADSLLLEDDAELRYYRGIAARYGSMSYLVIT
ncbi:MAG: putative RND superfamily exporter protein, partial [Gammaproteobacteria bacterium]